jgi:hypothetical protein
VSDTKRAVLNGKNAQAERKRWEMGDGRERVTEKESKILKEAEHTERERERKSSPL